MLNQSMMLAVWCASSLAVAVWQDVAQPPIAGEKGGKVNDKSQRWKDLDPMLIGSVREILIDDSLPHLTPTRSVPIPEQCKMPRAILAVSGDPDSILLFGFNEAGAHLWLVDGTSGAIKKTLHSMKKDWPTEQTLIPLGKGSGVLFQPGNGAPILQIRTDGSEHKQFGGTGEGERPGPFLVVGGVLAAMKDQETIRRWKLAT